MKIFIGADHGGYDLKNTLISFLKEKKHLVEDCGADFLDPGDDYPEISFNVAEKVQQEANSVGILICRSGGGATIAANKVKGIRAVAASDEKEASHAKTDNDAQILVLGADFVASTEKAKKIVEAFLNTPFSGESRHARRIGQIANYEEEMP